MFKRFLSLLPVLACLMMAQEMAVASTWTQVIDQTYTGATTVGPAGVLGGSQTWLASATCTSTGTTTSVLSNPANIPIIGLQITFAANTTTVADRGAVTYITAVSGTGPFTLTVSPAIPAASVSGDTFSLTQFWGAGTASQGSDGNWLDVYGNDCFISPTTGLNLYTVNNVLPMLQRPLAEAYQDERVVFYCKGTNPITAQLRYQPGGNTTAPSTSQGYTVTWATGIGLRINAAGTVNTLTVGGSDLWKIDFSVVGTNPTVCTALMTNITTTLTQTATISDSTSGLQCPGLFVLSPTTGSPGNAAPVSRVTTYYDATVTGPAALIVGRPYITSATTTTVSLSIPPATGGVPPYTYTWYCSPATGASAGSGFTPPGTGTVAGTGQTITATLPDVTNRYFYKCLVTDSTGGTPLTVVSAQVGGVLYTSPYSLTIGYIGDSITWGYPGNTGFPNQEQAGYAYAPFYASLYLQNCYGIRQCGYIDRGRSSQTTLNWAPTGALYQNAMAAFGSPAQTPYIHIMLGSNDCRLITNYSKATFKSQMLSIVNDLVGRGYKVILSCPPYVDGPRAYVVFAGAWDDTSNNLLTQYLSAITEIAAANPLNVFLGDTTAFDYFRANPALLNDGVHPTTVGYNNLGTLWGVGISKALGLQPAPSGSGTTKQKI